MLVVLRVLLRRVCRVRGIPLPIRARGNDARWPGRHIRHDGRRAARPLLVKRVEGGIATTITLEAGDSSHAIEMGEIGTIDIDATVEQAFAPYRANPVVRAVVTVGELIGMPPAGHDVCTVCVVDHDALVDRVAAVAQKANAPAKNAGYAYDKTSNARRRGGDPGRGDGRARHRRAHRGGTCRCRQR